MSSPDLLLNNWVETAFYYLASWFGYHDWMMTVKNILELVIHLLDWLAYIVYGILHAVISAIF